MSQSNASVGRPPATSREELEAVALDLFARHGFEHTTVDDIAEAAGVSRRTFFRYYPSKNDVVWGAFDELLDAMGGWLAATPAAMPPLQAVGEAVVRFNSLPPEAVPAHRQRMELILRVPALQAHGTLRYADWRAVIARFVAARQASDEHASLPQLVGHVSLGVAMAAYEQWLVDEHAALDDLLHDGFAKLAAGLAPDLHGSDQRAADRSPATAASGQAAQLDTDLAASGQPTRLDTDLAASGQATRLDDAHRPDPHASGHPTRLADAHSPDLAEQQAVLLVPLGSTEQHGPHLPLDTDTRIATALAERAATELEPTGIQAWVAPAVAYGSSGEHAGFAGTLSIGQAALEQVVVELCRSAGPDATVVLVCGHAGNADPLRRAVHTLQAERRAVRAWFPAVPGGDAHAGHTETSLLLHLDPECVDLERAEVGVTTPIAKLLPELRTRGVAGVSPNGVLGDPTGATASDGEHLFRTLVASLVNEVAGGEGP